MEEVVSQLVEEVRNRYYGKYRGFVVDNQDPKQRGRLRLRVPSILGSEPTPWALPCAPYGGLGDQGWLFIPDPGAQVWVEFEGGSLRHPLWTGTFWQSENDAPVLDGQQSTTRVLRTTKGHTLRLEDGDDIEEVRLEHASGASLDMDAAGSVALTDAGGARLTLDNEAGQAVLEDANGNTLTMTSTGAILEDANGNRVEMTATGVTVKGQQIVLQGTQVLLGGQGGEPILKGQTFLTLFATHIHTSSTGPTSPPIPQGEAAALSTTVLTK